MRELAYLWHITYGRGLQCKNLDLPGGFGLIQTNYLEFGTRITKTSVSKMTKLQTKYTAQRLLEEGRLSATEIAGKTGLPVIEIIFMRCQLPLIRK